MQWCALDENDADAHEEMLDEQTDDDAIGTDENLGLEAVETQQTGVGQ